MNEVTEQNAEQRKRKVIQISSAPDNLRVATYDDDGNRTSARVVCLALLDEGQVQPMIIDSEGSISLVRDRCFYLTSFCG